MPSLKLTKRAYPVHAASVTTLGSKDAIVKTYKARLPGSCRVHLKGNNTSCQPILHTVAKDTVITTEKKRALLHEALQKQGGIPKKILVVPPDMTRLHSNAGELTRILYELWDAANGDVFDILPATGTHAPMTPTQHTEMYGELPKAMYHVHNWRSGLHHFGEVPAEFVQQVSGGKVNYPIPVSVNHRLAEGYYDMILSVGQVIPHEVVGMANGFKNILIGTGGVETINKSHFLGAVDGMERLMGRTDTSVRKVLNYAHEHYSQATRHCLCHERHGC